MKYLLILLMATTANAASVNLAWDASPTVGVTNYVLYAGTNTLASTNLNKAIIKMNVGTNLTATATWPGTNQMYFVATAVAANVESDVSNTVIVRAPSAPANMLTVALKYSATVDGPFTNALFLGLQIISPTP